MASASETRLPRVVAFQIEAARRLGLEARVLDPEYGHLFELSDGRRSKRFLGGRSPLNDSVAARLAEDKFYTAMLLERAGVRVPRTARCLKPGHFTAYAEIAGAEAGIDHAEALGYPVIAKPNRKSHGREVVEVGSREELLQAIERIWAIDYIALVQERVAAPDIRIDFLDGRFLLGYERLALSVEGDGTSTLRELVEAIEPRGDGFWEGVHRDPEWAELVAARGLDRDSVLEPGVALDLGGTVMNLNRWARAVPIWELSPRWEEYGLSIGEAMGLRHFGVDLRGAGLEDDPRSASVVEVNASPLLLRMYEMGHAERALAAQGRVLAAAMGP